MNNIHKFNAPPITRNKKSKKLLTLRELMINENDFGIYQKIKKINLEKK